MKRLVFTILAVGIPFVLFGALEGALRWAGVGQAERPVFAAVPGQAGYQKLNAAYFRRYFNETFEPVVAFDPFRTEKPAGAFRVMVLGGSSVAGFPYRFYLGFPAHLQARLEAEAVGQPVEVINLGVTAANSYALWDLKEAVVAQQPDAVVLYSGHNEYYGAFGAGSTVNALGNRIWVKRLVLRLKRLVLYRQLERLLATLAPRRGDGRSLMTRMIRDAQISLGSPTYQAGLDQFEANLRDALQKFRQAGIPVYLGTLASNLKDQPPLGENEHAWADYTQGFTLLEQGDTLRARGAFLLAKEQDDIRFRAPEALNEILRAFARDGLGTLVDVQALAAASSASRVEDETFFADHLHPNYDAYDAIAGAFFEALKEHPALARRGVARAPRTVPLADPFERLYGRLQVYSINVGYPFNKSNSPEQEEVLLQHMLGRVRSSRNYLDQLAYRTIVNEITAEDAIAEALPTALDRADTLYALQLYRSLLYWRPFDAALLREAVDFSVENARANPRYVSLAEAVLLHAVNRTQDAGYLNLLASLKLSRGSLDEAATLLALAEARDPGSEDVRRTKVRLVAMRQDSLSAAPR